MLSLSPGHVFPLFVRQIRWHVIFSDTVFGFGYPLRFYCHGLSNLLLTLPKPLLCSETRGFSSLAQRHPEVVVEEITPLLFPSKKPHETQNHIELEQDEMATACTVAQYLKCVNLEVEEGFSEVQGERFSWGLGGNLRWGLRSIAERCTWLCESNMRALLKDLRVSLPLVLFRHSQADKDLSHTLFGLSKVEASLNM